jgi:hypothetical protein
MVLALYVRSWAKKFLSHVMADSSILVNNIDEMFQQLFTTLLSPHLESKVKQPLTVVGETLFSTYSFVLAKLHPKKAGQENMVDSAMFNALAKLTNLVTQAVTNDPTKLKGGIIATKLIINSINNEEVGNQLINAPMQFLIQVLEGQKAILTSNMALYEEASKVQPLPIDSEIVVNILGALDVMKVWVENVWTTMERFEHKNFFLFDKFASNELFITSMVSILGILVSNQNQPQEVLISISGLEKLDNDINNLKVNSLQILNLLIEYVFNNCPLHKSQNWKIFEQVSLVLNVICSSMMFLSKSDLWE